MLKGLSVLRISGALIRFGGLNFSSKLVEFHIQDVTLGHDTEIGKLMNALSSASQLRDLRIISIITFPNDADVTIPNVSLPNLQYLLVRDLYSNTMRQILKSISTRLHHLTLYLTRKCLMIQHVEDSEPEDIDADDLHELLAQVPVHTLSIDGEAEWMDDPQLDMIMRAVPDLKTLRLHCWGFDKDSCEALKRPKSHTKPEASLPALENIHISCARIWGDEVFKSMVASYTGCLRRMVLGAALTNYPEADLDPLEGDEDLVAWLEANVPEFELIDNAYKPLEFRGPEWELW